LETRFLLFSLVVLVVGAFVIGSWASSTVRAGVLARSAATTALFAESFLGPEIEDARLDEPLDPRLVTRLDGLFVAPGFRDRIVSFRIWSPNGVVRYSRDHRSIGKTYPPEGNLTRVFEGKVISGISSLDEPEHVYEAARWERLVETYVPIRSLHSGNVVAAAEFYELPDDLEAELSAAQRDGWLIVGLATVTMFILLNGMVRAAGRTIRRQNSALIAIANRLRLASARAVEADEAMLRRVSQDLHDGPAQDLALASLQIDQIREAVRDAEDAPNVDLVAEAVKRALVSMRDASEQLALPVLDDLSPRQIAERAADQHQHRTGELVEVSGDAERAPPPPVAATVFRMIAEALANSARHGGPGLRRVSIGASEGQLRVVVEDRGRGFDPTHTPENLGLRGVRERAEMLGGRMSVQSRPDDGTTVTLEIPSEAL
jgi:signal transduction histidine kinase